MPPGCGLLLSVVFSLLQVAVPAGAVAGTVRAPAIERPLAGVRVEADGVPATGSDWSGHDEAGLTAGSHRLRFMLAGFASQDVAVLLPDFVSQMQVDVEPRAAAGVLAAGRGRGPRALGRRRPGTGDGQAEIGRGSLGGDWLDGRQAGEGDVQQALADLPGVQNRRESAAGLHVRGGATSENLVLLDGLPHFWACTTREWPQAAVDPDAVASADLHTGISPARFGDHLAGVGELDTRDPGPFASPRPWGSLGPGDIRQTMTGYLPGIRTGILIGGRATYRDALMGEGIEGHPNAYDDLLGVATSRLGRGRLRLISFSASNRVDFPSVSDAGLEPDGPASNDREELSGTPRNAIAWSSHTQGLTWSETGPRGGRFDAAAWWAGSAADIRWLGSAGAEQLHSDFSEVGVSARAAWPDAGGGTTVGASLVRPGTRYDAVRASAMAGAPAARLSLDAAPAIGSVFAERLMRPSGRLLLSSGLRASTDFSGWAALEPRVTAVFTPDARTRVGVGLGRSHQPVQSLVNDESALGSLVGFDIPAAGGRLPIARADQLEAMAGRRLGPFDLSVTGYLRRTRGLALGSVSTAGLFPADSVVVGRGYASGVIGALAVEQGRVAGRAVVTVARDVRASGLTRYDAGYGQGTSIALDLGYRFLRDTRLLLQFRAGAHQPTSVVSPGFEWQPSQMLSESGELAGTPENRPGALNATNLPDYARLDLGLRRTWHVPGTGRIHRPHDRRVGAQRARPAERARLRRAARRRPATSPRRPPIGHLRGRLAVLTPFRAAPASYVTCRWGGAFV